MRKKIFPALMAIAAIAVNAQTVQVWRGGQVRTTLMNADSITFVENINPADEDEHVYAPNRELTGKSYDTNLAVQLNQGTYVGYEKPNGVKCFKGIPYAQTPTGNLRWQRPQPLPQSDKVYEAYHFGHTCVQKLDETEQASSYEQGEDMLTVNVWTADLRPATKRPVMVYIHGGNFVLGGTADPLYNPTNFVQNHKDIIVVTMNYRVNIWGYLNARFFEDGNDPQYKDINGNLAHLDQIAALKWVRDNISKFGGDSTNITLFGESAGCVSTGVLVLSDDIRENGKPIIKNAILHSCGMNLIMHPNDAGVCEDSLKARFNITKLSQLKTIPAETINKVWTELSNIGVPIMPNADSTVIPADPVLAWADGRAKDINIMQGYNSGEFTYFKTMDILYPIILNNLESYLARRVAPENKEEYEAARKQYYDAIMAEFDIKPDTTTEEGRLRFQEEIADDWLFLTASALETEEQTASGGKGYFYYFDYLSDALRRRNMRVGHAAELPFVFGNKYPEYWDQTAEELEMSAIMQDIWANFAKTGNPSFSYSNSQGSGSIIWPTYDAANRQVVHLTLTPKLVPNFRKARTEAAQKMLLLSPDYHYSKFVDPYLIFKDLLEK